MRGTDVSMAVRNHVPSSPPLRYSLTSSPALSAVRSSPLIAESFGLYPFTSSPFSSSQIFPITQIRSSHSPDLFDDFIYSKDMDDDFRRIDSDAAAIIEAENSQTDHTNLSQSSSVHIFLPTPPRNRRTWVVFHGRLPGIYDYGYTSPFITESSACPLS